MRMVACGIVLLLAAGAAAAAPSTRGECESAGGKWGRFGMRQQELCDLPTADAAKACTDAKDCATACVAPESAPVGSQAVGQCYGRTVLLGTCLKQVRGGVVEPALCAD